MTSWAGKAWRGLACRGMARHGTAGPGEAGPGVARPWPGAIGLGRAGRSAAWLSGAERGVARRGLARLGQARRGSAGRGSARRGEAGRGRAGPGEATYNEERRGPGREPRRSNHHHTREGTAMATKTRIATPDDEGNGPMPQRFGIELPYTITLRIRGVTPFLFNRMDIEAYDQEEGPGGKRKPRLRPDYEAMIWRNDAGELAFPVRNVIASIVAAGKYFKSPIAGNGSATPTLREALQPGPIEYGTFGVTQWDTVDFRQARHGDMKGTPKPTYRPRLEVGWLLETFFGVVTPELYGPAKLLEVISRAGSVMGVGDGRKIGFGRYVLDSYDLAEGLPW